MHIFTKKVEVSDGVGICSREGKQERNMISALAQQLQQQCAN